MRPYGLDGGLELFDPQTRLGNGQLAANGYLALAELDGNHDGQIDAQDTAYAALQIWQDRNGDGISQPNELLSLSAAKVLNIATSFSASYMEA